MLTMLYSQFFQFPMQIGKNTKLGLQLLIPSQFSSTDSLISPTLNDGECTGLYLVCKLQDLVVWRGRCLIGTSIIILSWVGPGSFTRCAPQSQKPRSSQKKRNRKTQ